MIGCEIELNDGITPPACRWDVQKGVPGCAVPGLEDLRHVLVEHGIYYTDRQALRQADRS